jgi:hypothetical protein
VLDLTRGIRVNDYIFLMHQLPGLANQREDWGSYFAQLRSTGQFAGGSAIGNGVRVSKSGVAGVVDAHLAGYIRVTANSLQDAQALLAGNPVFEAGGTIEIRELPKSKG